VPLSFRAMTETCPDCGAELRLLDPPAAGVRSADTGYQLAECPAPDCGQRFERPAPTAPWRPLA
jgi:rRNA maturation protein Nop10